LSHLRKNWQTAVRKREGRRQPRSRSRTIASSTVLCCQQNKQVINYRLRYVVHGRGAICIAHYDVI